MEGKKDRRHFGRESAAEEGGKEKTQSESTPMDKTVKTTSLTLRRRV